MGWLTRFIEENYKLKQIAKKKRSNEELKPEQRNNYIQPDNCCWNTFLFTSLKLLKHYNKIV